MKSKALNLLKSLTEAHGAPGSEDGVRAIFTQELQSCGDISHDQLGSTVCTRSGPRGGPRVLITAHFDEVGFAVQSITRQGFVKFVALGGWWTHNLLAQRVRILTKSGREVLGIVGSTPPHFLTEGQRDKVLPIEQLFIDVGAASREEAMEELGLGLGDPIVPHSEFTHMAKSDLLVSKAFDNRVGCAVMIQVMQELAKRKTPNTLIAAGTVQEEVGCRGAVTAAAEAKPDVAIILEGTPADDAPPGPDEPQGSLGKGVQIRLLDPTALMHRRLVEFARTTATKSHIPHQIAVRRSGGTDAKSFQIHHTGVPCVVLGVPARYIHSHNSILHLQDYFSAVDLVRTLVQNLDAKAVAKLRTW